MRDGLADNLATANDRVIDEQDNNRANDCHKHAIEIEPGDRRSTDEGKQEATNHGANDPEYDVQPLVQAVSQQVGGRLLAHGQQFQAGAQMAANVFAFTGDATRSMAPAKLPTCVVRQGAQTASGPPARRVIRKPS